MHSEAMEQLKIKTSWEVGGGCKEEEEEALGGGGEPVSPNAQYYSSSVLSVAILAVFELEVPIDELRNMVDFLRDTFVPFNPRFSSIMVTGNDGKKRWKRVEITVEDHLKVATFPPDLSQEYCYDNQFDEYLTKLAAEPLPKNQPLWEVHIVNYPTSKAAGHLIFKLHHALGDGYSLMGALFAGFKRADNPSLPLTFPLLSRANTNNATGWCTRVLTSVPKAMYVAYNTLREYGYFLKNTVIEDNKSPIRSGIENLEHKPIQISTVEFSLDKIKQIKVELGVTINDVVTGIINHGVRLYMKGRSENWASSRTTALVMMNTRNITDGYKPVSEMMRPNESDGRRLWGNRFTVLHVPVLEAHEEDGFLDPLQFVVQAKTTIQRKRSSSFALILAYTLMLYRKYAGFEAIARFIYKSATNASMSMSNVVGPVEKMAVARHPVKGFYFMVVGVPTSLFITILSYMDTLRIGIGVEKDFIDVQEFKSCVEKAFELTFNGVRNKEKRVKSS